MTDYKYLMRYEDRQRELRRLYLTRSAQAGLVLLTLWYLWHCHFCH